MKRIRHVPKVLRAYWRARRLQFTERAALLSHQHLMLQQFMALVTEYSPFYAAYAGAPLSDWPQMDKPRMLANFGRINTVGLQLEDVMAAALAAERSRDFTPTLRGYTVGLSSGTSGRRGAFVVSSQERAAWAGTLLAKALPGGLFDPGQRVALLLRANSNLYETIRLPWLKFAFFDLLQPFADTAAALAAYRPTVVVAPAQVLRELALGRRHGSTMRPFTAVSVAEVLDARDRALIEDAFGPVHELYQATEGFLGATCSQHRLHLNEAYLHVEQEWLLPAAEGRRRFVPVITDFSRLTQPIVRYRLDDVLVASQAPCSCGNVELAIDAVEGRCDDALQLPQRQGGLVTVFADVMHRIIAQALPLEAEYQLVQNGPCRLKLLSNTDVATARQCRQVLSAMLEQQGVDVAALAFEMAPLNVLFDPAVKRRRVVRACQP